MIGTMKQEWNTPELVKGLPPEFLTIMDHIQSLSFNDAPDYDYIKSLLLSALTAQGGDEHQCGAPPTLECLIFVLFL